MGAWRGELGLQKKSLTNLVAERRLQAHPAEECGSISVSQQSGSWLGIGQQGQWSARQAQHGAEESEDEPESPKNICDYFPACQTL